MANDFWTTVEEAVLAALQGELEGQVKTLVTYQGDCLADLHRSTGAFRRCWCSCARAGASRSPQHPMT